MKLTMKENKVLELIKDRNYVTISDFRKIYKTPYIASNTLKKFVLLRIINMDATGRFKVNHNMVAKYDKPNIIITSQCVKGFKCKHYPLNLLACSKCKHYKNDFPDEFTLK